MSMPVCSVSDDEIGVNETVFARDWGCRKCRLSLVRRHMVCLSVSETERDVTRYGLAFGYFTGC